LIELFRELQLLTTDYLRQRALYGIQDLVTRFLTEESLETDGAGFNPMNYQSWLGSTSEPTASESVVTSEGLSEGDENPFEQDNLGDTVIHFGDSLKHVRRLEESFNEADSTLVATPQTQETSIEVDSQQLDNEIKTVMMVRYADPAYIKLPVEAHSFPAPSPSPLSHSLLICSM
jgi:hypothetical protein